MRILGNEEPDRLAKSASRRVPVDNNTIDSKDLFSLLKIQAKNGTSQFIQDYARGPVPKGSRFVQFSQEFRLTEWFKGTGIDRKRIGIANRILSGHHRTKAHLHRMNIVDDPTCECGEDRETMEHIFWRCPKYLEYRVRFMYFVHKKGIDFDSEIDKVAIQGDLETLIRLVSFISDNKSCSEGGGDFRISSLKQMR